MDKQFHGVVSKDGMGAMRFVKTHLGEGDVACDKCGRLVKRGEAIEIWPITSDRIAHQCRRCSNGAGEG
jgi:ribosomal protein S26